MDAILSHHTKPNGLILTFSKHDEFDILETKNYLGRLGLDVLFMSSSEFNELLTRTEEFAEFFANTYSRKNGNSQLSIYGEVIDFTIDFTNKDLFTSLRGKVVLRNDGCDSSYVLGPNLCRKFLESSIVVGDYISMGRDNKEICKICKDDIEATSSFPVVVSIIQESELFSLFQTVSSICTQTLDNEHEIWASRSRIIAIYDAHLLNSLAKSILNNFPEPLPFFLLLNCVTSQSLGIHYPSIAYHNLISKSEITPLHD